MRVVTRYYYRIGKAPELGVGVGEAVERQCVSSDYDDTIDRLRDNAGTTAELVGRLVQELHEARVLSDDAVLRIIGSGFKKADD